MSLTLALSACGNLTPRTPPSSAARPPAPASAPAASSQAGSPQAPGFDQVIKGAERADGLLPIWRKQDKVWLELSPKALGQPYFLSPKLATGIGEAGLFGGLMQSRSAQVGRPQLVEFRKVQQQIQLLAINSHYTAQSGTPQALAVAAAYSPSLLASVPISSAPHPQSGAILIDASALLQGDLLGLAAQLQRAYRQSYALDPRNTALLETRTQSDNTVFEVSQHFATGTIAAPSGVPGPSSSVPTSLPDPRSLFIKVHYTLSALPTQPMPRRPADPRVGYFTSTVMDFSSDLARTPVQHYINRWRLEKKDPQAPLSDPVQPLVFWLDPSIPEVYRAAITEGALEWNKAFAAIGFSRAIEVRTPPADKPFDTLATGHASIRWMTNSQPGFGAIGPSHVDPRTGEILDADIALESLSSRAIRTMRSQTLMGHLTDVHEDGDAPCEHGQYAAQQLEFALATSSHLSPMDPDAPAVRDFVLAYIKDTTMHEVGHALGLRHNFRASTWRSPGELLNPVLTREQGNSASVMDYNAINLPPPGQHGGSPFQTTLGPYDYWAIEYGYKPLPADANQAKAVLREVADRSGAPQFGNALAFGTDEDNAAGLDPEVIMFDLGNDPIAFARTRMAIVRDLLTRMEHHQANASEEAGLARRRVQFAWRELDRTSQILLRQLGGLITRRDALASRPDLLDPLPAERQRAALALLSEHFLSAKAWSLSPSLQRSLAPDYLSRSEAGDGSGTDFVWNNQLLALQRTILNTLMSDSLAERLLDNQDKSRDREKHPLTSSDIHQTLFKVIWKQGAQANGQEAARRNLQREHINRLAANVVKSGSTRADVRSVIRQQARQLLSWLKTSPISATEASLERAHRRDCIDTLQAALAAQVNRPAP